MTKYFDKDFWRFFMGFVAIICTSLIILFASRLYQDDSLLDSQSQEGSAIMSVEGN
jgi:hypothetical protein